MQHLKYATRSDDESVRAHAEGTDVLAAEARDAGGGQGVDSLIERLKDATSGDD